MWGYQKIGDIESQCPSGCDSQRSIVLPANATSASDVAVACPRCKLVADIATLPIALQFSAFEMAAQFLETGTAEGASQVRAVKAATSAAASNAMASPPAEARREFRSSPDDVHEAKSEIDHREFAQVVRMSPDEAALLATSMLMNVGEPARDRRRSPRFTVRRLRRPHFDAAGRFEVFAELVRHHASRRETVLGFSREEVVALQRGLKSRDEQVLVQDASSSVVGFFKMPRINGKRPGAIELFRKRELPRYRRIR